jgi:hypothetical protein
MNMSDNAIPGHRYLSADHAKSTEADQEWDRDNQQWWDWYMSLAENEPDESKEPLIELPQPISHPAPDLAALVTELRKPFALSPAQIDSFGRNGYIKLKDVLPPGALSLLRRELAAMFEQESEQLGHRFGSLEMMWEQNQIVRAFVFSTRLARLAAACRNSLGVDELRGTTTTIIFPLPHKTSAPCGYLCRKYATPWGLWGSPKAWMLSNS